MSFTTFFKNPGTSSLTVGKNPFKKKKSVVEDLDSNWNDPEEAEDINEEDLIETPTLILARLDYQDGKIDYLQYSSRWNLEEDKKNLNKNQNSLITLLSILNQTILNYTTLNLAVLNLTTLEQNLTLQSLYNKEEILASPNTYTLGDIIDNTAEGLYAKLIEPTLTDDRTGNLVLLDITDVYNKTPLARLQKSQEFLKKYPEEFIKLTFPNGLNTDFSLFTEDEMNSLLLYYNYKLDSLNGVELVYNKDDISKAAKIYNDKIVHPEIVKAWDTTIPFVPYVGLIYSGIRAVQESIGGNYEDALRKATMALPSKFVPGAMSGWTAYDALNGNYDLAAFDAAFATAPWLFGKASKLIKKEENPSNVTFGKNVTALDINQMLTEQAERKAAYTINVRPDETPIVNDGKTISFENAAKLGEGSNLTVGKLLIPYELSDLEKLTLLYNPLDRFIEYGSREALPLTEVNPDNIVYGSDLTPHISTGNGTVGYKFDTSLAENDPKVQELSKQIDDLEDLVDRLFFENPSTKAEEAEVKSKMNDLWTLIDALKTEKEAAAAEYMEAHKLNPANYVNTEYTEGLNVGAGEVSNLVEEDPSLIIDAYTGKNYTGDLNNVPTSELLQKNIDKFKKWYSEDVIPRIKRAAEGEADDVESLGFTLDRDHLLPDDFDYDSVGLSKVFDDIAIKVIPKLSNKIDGWADSKEIAVMASKYGMDPETFIHEMHHYLRTKLERNDAFTGIGRQNSSNLSRIDYNYINGTGYTMGEADALDRAYEFLDDFINSHNIDPLREKGATNTLFRERIASFFGGDNPLTGEALNRKINELTPEEMWNLSGNFGVTTMNSYSLNFAKAIVGKWDKLSEKVKAKYENNFMKYFGTEWCPKIKHALKYVGGTAVPLAVALGLEKGNLPTQNKKGGKLIKRSTLKEVINKYKQNKRQGLL